MGTKFKELWNDPEFIDDAQKAKINREVALIGKIIEIRKAKGLSQRELAKVCGVMQPAIARMESRKSTPKIDTVIKALEPLGYTLDVVPIKRKQNIKAKKKALKNHHSSLQKTT